MTRAHQGRDMAGRTTRIDASAPPGQPGRRTLVETIAPGAQDYPAQAPTQAARDELALAPAVTGSTTGIVQAKRALPAGGHLVGPELARPRLTAGAGGQPLTEPARSKMEAAFQADFSTVRIFQDGQAAELGAEAFTRGEHIHFQPGRYDPESASGLQLLGHELAHVIQQRASRVAAPADGGVVNAASDLEAEADRQGEQAARGAPASATCPTATPGSPGRADDPVQLRTALTSDQLGVLRFGRQSSWYYISDTGTPHVSFYLDEESHRYLDTHCALRPQSSSETVDLSDHAGKLTYDELHVKLGNERYCFYADDGTPRSKSEGPGKRDSIPFGERDSWHRANSILAEYASAHMGGVWSVWALNIKFNAVAFPFRLPDRSPPRRSKEEERAEKLRREQTREALSSLTNTFKAPRRVTGGGHSTTLKRGHGDMQSGAGTSVTPPDPLAGPTVLPPPVTPSPMAVPPKPAAGVADLYAGLSAPIRSAWSAAGRDAGEPSPDTSEPPSTSQSAQGSAKRAKHELVAASDRGDERREKARDHDGEDGEERGEKARDHDGEGEGEEEGEE